METKAMQMDRLATADGGMYADHDDFYRVQSDGTTIMAIKFKGGILLGADSRSSNVSLTLILNELAINQVWTRH